MTVPDMRWRKASRSGQEGNCVEVGRTTDGTLAAVQDSKNRGPSLAVNVDALTEWAKRIGPMS